MTFIRWTSRSLAPGKYSTLLRSEGRPISHCETWTFPEEAVDGFKTTEVLPLTVMCFDLGTWLGRLAIRNPSPDTSMDWKFAFIFEWNIRRFSQVHHSLFIQRKLHPPHNSMSRVQKEEETEAPPEMSLASHIKTNLLCY
jgi:hypothetical protein